MMKYKFFILFLFVLLKTFSQETIPVLKDFITDEASVLGYDEYTALEDRLKKHETETTSQIKVVIVDILPNITIEDYAFKTFEKNKIGREKEDKGVLILASIKDFKIKIEVGSGLKSKLTTPKISGIINRVIGAEFNKKKYYRGINFGITEIISTINNTSTFNKSTIINDKAYTQEGIPILQNFVTDKAKLLSVEELEVLEKRLKHYETKTTNQIVVVTIESLNGEVLEDYAYRLFNENKIGQEKEDNGLLILISKEDRKVRLEVGLGFEHLITDAKSSRIIREIITPNFKKEKYYKGVNLAVTEVIALINNTTTLKDNTADKKDVEIVWKVLKIIGVILLSCFIIFLLVIVSRNFVIIYPSIINSFRGFLVGKVVLSDFVKVFFMNSIGIVLSLIGLLPLGTFAIIGLGSLLRKLGVPTKKIGSVLNFNLDLILVLTLILVLFVALVFIPFLIAFFNRSHVKGLPIKILYNHSDTSDEKYLKKYFNYSPASGSSRSRGYSSSGSSSYSSSSSFSSSSSSSSFSGGGGSSGGGGASGSW